MEFQIIGLPNKKRHPWINPGARHVDYLLLDWLCCSLVTLLDWLFFYGAAKSAGAGGGIRTLDLLFTKQLLCH